jgi:hypothetical protein
MGAYFSMKSSKFTLKKIGGVGGGGRVDEDMVTGFLGTYTEGKLWSS